MLEDLLEVIGHLVIGEAAVTHDEVVRMLFGNLGDGALVHLYKVIIFKVPFPWMELEFCRVLPR